MTVQANYSEGIKSRDGLKITGGNISITAMDSEDEETVELILHGVSIKHDEHAHFREQR